MNSAQVNQLFEMHEQSLVKHLMDQRVLNANQCYFVLQWRKGCTMFATKALLENYLQSLAPTFEYGGLSELAVHLIENGMIVDVSVTKKQK
jgi:hypothetical protein